MSWAGGDWTVGLTGQVQQKVQQILAQNEKLNKERQQRQLQLDNTEAALHKQKQKYEELRVELTVVQRELGGVREAAQSEVRTRERLSHDLQVKTGQVHSLEGQLESARKLTQTLTLEVKRLEAELEKLQKTNVSGESVLFSTPCWNISSPWENNGAFRTEGETRVRQQLQFGDTSKVSAGSPSPLPQQINKSPSVRHHTRQSEPSTPSSVFPWEREDSRPTPKGQSAPSVAFSDVGIRNNDSGMEEALRNEIDDLRVRVSQLQREAKMESELSKETESHLTQAHKEISAKEQALTRTQDQLARAQARITQETDRAQASEQKIKQLQDELKCQRQNAESSRINAEQRRKDMEKEHQRELLELQRERQAMDKQHQQESNRLNQEIQQARALHNALQAQHDKVCLQKQGLEKDLEDVRGKLKSTETDLKESQKREMQTEAKLTEAVREAEGLAVCLGQVKKQEKVLQEEVKRLSEELAEALRLIKELQAQLAAPPLPHFRCGGDFSPAIPLSHDRSPPSNHAAQRNQPPTTSQARGQERISYPGGREPGEGIDSEHIKSFVSEESQRTKGKSGKTCKREYVEFPVTEQMISTVNIDTDSLNYDSNFEKNLGCNSDITGSLMDTVNEGSGDGSKEDALILKGLKKENAELRDELRDVKCDLQKRLEDLEAQRRAEAEARTKLKQLSRKHSTQTEQQRTKTLELKDSVTKLETQLEEEKKEKVKLKDTLALLENEVKKSHEDESSHLKEVLAESELKETCMEEEILKMKKNLKDLQLTLAVEREERELERKQMKKDETEGLRIAQLQQELDDLQKSSCEKLVSTTINDPVAYLQLENENHASLNSICASVNLQNTIVCNKSTESEFIMHSGVQTEPSGTNTEASSGALAPHLDSMTRLLSELECLRAEKDGEAEKSKLAQRKLEDLQKQVTTQTEHLTNAFESQSKNIANLLRELHDKETAFQEQRAELQKCQETIIQLKQCQLARQDVSPGEEQAIGQLSTQISRELSCDSFFSNTSVSDQDIFSEETTPDLKLSLPPAQPTEYFYTLNDETMNTSNKPQIDNVIGNSHTQCVITNPEVVSRTKGTINPVEIVQEASEVLEVQHHSELDDLSELKSVTDELINARLDLKALKSLAPQDVMDVMQEELLNPKQKQLLGEDSSASCAIGEERNSDLGKTEIKTLPKIDEPNPPSAKQEMAVPNEHANAAVHSLQEQIYALQQRCEFLSQQNQTQAQELEIWKALELTASDNTPAVVQQEFQLLLPCRSSESPKTRTMVLQRAVNEMINCPEPDTNVQINLEEHVLPEKQRTHDVTGSQRAAEDHTSEHKNGVKKENHQTTSVRNLSIFVSNTTTSRIEHDPMLLQTNPADCRQSPQTNAVNDPRTNNSQEADAVMNASMSAKYQREIISSNTITGSSGTGDSQNSEAFTDCESIEAVSLNKHRHFQGDGGDEQSQSSLLYQAVGERVREAGRRSNREAKSVCTQTEEQHPESSPIELLNNESRINACTQTDNVHLAEEEDDEAEEESPPLSPTPKSVSGQLLFSRAFPMSDPANLAERIRQNRSRMSAAYDETEYEPYGLPEVVMKGFADIPTGPACPYVLRRGLLGTDAAPRSDREGRVPDKEEDIEL